jgi:hypothetical protein
VLSRDLLVTYLRYEEDTGKFYWIKQPGPARNTTVGSIAGSVDKYGYIVIGMMNREYKAHRLAWLYHYGEWPSGIIDHINTDRADNRISNLREANKSENGYNRRRNRNNTSGYTGVFIHKRTGYWHARISKIHLGCFDTPEKANEARLRALDEHYGQFIYSGQEQSK